MRDQDFSREMINQFLTMYGLEGLQPGSDAITAKVRAEFVGHGFDDLEEDAAAVGLTVNEYAYAVDRIAGVIGGDVLDASNQIDYWTTAAGIAMNNTKEA